MFYALIGLPTLKALASMGLPWAVKKVAKALDKEEPSQADDNYVDKVDK